MYRGLGEGVPVTLDQADERLGAAIAQQFPATEGAAEQDQARHTLGAARRVGDGDTAREIETEQGKPLSPSSLHDRLEISQHRLERDLVHISLRLTRSAPVILDQAQVRGQRAVRLLKTRNLPLGTDIAERHPGKVDQRRSRPGNGIANCHTIGGRCLCQSRLHDERV
jgi:hypothetical protein